MVRPTQHLETAMTIHVGVEMVVATRPVAATVTCRFVVDLTVSPLGVATGPLAVILRPSLRR